MFKIITTKKFNQMQSTIDELQYELTSKRELVNRLNLLYSKAYIRNEKGQIVKVKEVEL